METEALGLRLEQFSTIQAEHPQGPTHPLAAGGCFLLPWKPLGHPPCLPKPPPQPPVGEGRPAGLPKNSVNLLIIFHLLMNQIASRFLLEI